MTIPSTPNRPPSRSLLTTESRRSLALLAGGDLDPSAATAAQTLADDCPDCRGHLASVCGGLEALRRAEPLEQPGGLWNGVQQGLAIASPAAAPAPSRPWIPVFAVTAAALLVGLFATPFGDVMPFLNGPDQGVVMPAAEQETVVPQRRPGEGVPKYQDQQGRVYDVYGNQLGPRSLSP
ncbi:hypothetical protein [Alienimonas chondri]|uniref:Zinc-finger domain-containing protein n=1 Tax=Alienimonas chondri TaxID=2681879 RepID=A0ABX1VCY7_9PLAN|nr:hypothetical protein [Alienimonas chondri]NNJ25826.1 hypothetical protein [Alienimonas chondri]